MKTFFTKLVAVSMVCSAISPAVFASADQNESDAQVQKFTHLTKSEKLAALESLKNDVRSTRSDLKRATLQVRGDQKKYDISGVAAKISGWSWAGLTALEGMIFVTAASNKATFIPSLKPHLALGAIFGIASYVKYSSGSDLTVDKAEKQELETTLAKLEKQIDALSAAVEAME